MGLNLSSKYDAVVDLIEGNDIDRLKEYINTLDKEEVKQFCIASHRDDELNRSLLHHAVWRDDSKILQILMPYCEGESLEVYDYYGMTPLCASINRGNFEAVKLLLEHSSKVNCDQFGGYLLLRSAVYKSSSDIVQTLIQYNCETNNTELDADRGSLLHVATDLGNLEVVKLLIEKGKLDANVDDKWKITPIHVAAAKNRLDILKYLQENGGNIDVEDVFGNTPLGWALFCKSEECSEFLKSLDAKTKEFIVPPPTSTIENMTTITNPNSNPEQIMEIIKNESAERKPEVHDAIPMTMKTEGTINPSFNINDEIKMATTVI